MSLQPESQQKLSLDWLASQLSARLVLNTAGTVPANAVATGISTLQQAGPTEISFLANQKYRKDLSETSALAVILHESMLGECPTHALVHPDPYQAYAALSRLLEARPRTPEGIHPAAQVDSTATIGQGACIAAGVVIGPGVQLGDGAEIGANTVIEASSVIGSNVYLAANVSIGYAVRLGDNVRVQAGTVIGSEGFGYAPDYSAEKKAVSWHRIAQLGSVIVGNNVEIGANTTIDRGALEDTVIEDNVIIDNQVQIAHNVVIGSGTAIAGCVGIAGSARIGKRCSIGGGAGIAGHLSIADDSTVLGMTLINRSVNRSGVYASGTGMQPAQKWRKNAVRFTQLETLNRRVQELEKKLADSKATAQRNDEAQ